MAQFTIQQAFDQAVQHHQAGRLRQAEAIYRQILVQQPTHAQSIHHLGVIALQSGQNDVAVEWIRRAIAIAPNYAQAHNNLGTALKNKGQLEPAIAAYRKAIAVNPNLSDAHHNLGLALKENGQLQEALIALQRAIALQPSLPDAYNIIGMVCKEMGQVNEAITAYRQAIKLNGKLVEAFNNLCNALEEKGCLDEAISAARQAIAIKPDCAEAHNNLGNVLRKIGQLDQAVAALRQAIILKPDYSVAYYNLGIALGDQGQLDQAIAAYRQALALNPDFSQAYNNLANRLKDQGQLEEAIAGFRKAITLRPDFVEANDNLVFALQSHPTYDGRVIAEELARWNRQHAQPLEKFIPSSYANNTDPDRRLRIGYVSPDFYNHSVSYFMLPLLAAHDHDRFEIFCYAQVSIPDRMTQQLREHADVWRSIVGLSDAETAQLIHDDQIDILVDLAGHTAGNRLLVFARKPAPVQVTYLGYPGSTGLQTIDYRLTDALADPPGLTDPYYTEQLIRLPKCAWCFGPQDAPTGPLPVLQNDQITFGSFNNFAKVNESMLKRWAQIMRQVPGSRLMLKSKAMACESVQRRIQQLMLQEGIAAERLDLRGWVPAAEHFNLYNQIDIALDTYPYHGTTTTCESIWMGIPVVTLAGQSHLSRVGVSLLTNVGLVDFIAMTPEQYVQIAVDLAANIPRLTLLHATLRKQMSESPLMDSQRFARDIEAAYRQMWKEKCESVQTARR